MPMLPLSILLLPFIVLLVIMTAASFGVLKDIARSLERTTGVEYCAEAAAFLVIAAVTLMLAGGAVKAAIVLFGEVLTAAMQ